MGSGWVPSRSLPALLAAGPPVVYQLLIGLEQPARLRIASLGAFTLPPGWYVYSGSAYRASAARLARHLRRRKTLRWHIDYLLARPRARVVAVRLWPWRDGLECTVNQALLHAGGARVPIPRFGSNDCRHACPAHLVQLGSSPLSSAPSAPPR